MKNTLELQALAKGDSRRIIFAPMRRSHVSPIDARYLAAIRKLRWSTKTRYWLTIVAVRSAGTTAGDWMAFREQPGLANGLGLGLPLSTALNVALFICVLLFWRAPESNMSMDC